MTNAARNNDMVAEVSSAVDISRLRRRIEQLESAMIHSQNELASRTGEILSLTARYQEELQAARAEMNGVRAEAASVMASKEARIKEVESAAAREREAHALRVHDLSTELRATQVGLDASVRWVRDRESMLSEQVNLLQASACREQSMLDQIQGLQSELIASRASERELHRRILERQWTFRNEIDAVKERLMLSAAAEEAQRKELDELRRACREAEVARSHQFEAMKQAESHERSLQQKVAELGEQLGSERERAARMTLRIAEVQSELVDMKNGCLLRLDIAVPGTIPLMSRDAKSRQAICPATDLTGLLRMLHEDFVECAYRTILGRAADPEGLAHYTQRVLAGDPKIEILRDLYRSQEARQLGVDHQWLKHAIARYERRASRVRRATRRLIGLEGSRPAAERLRIAEERLSYFRRQSLALGEELATRIGALEQRLSETRKHSSLLPDPQVNAIQEDRSRLATAYTPTPSTSESPSRHAGQLLGKSLVTKRVWRDLRDALGEGTGGRGAR